MSNGLRKAPGQVRQNGLTFFVVKISLQFYQGLADQEHWARVSDFTIERAP
jgi:hypothetical protein